MEQAYEDGKHRRYSLLFAVNGGAFAAARLLAAPAAAATTANATGVAGVVLGNLHLEHLALGMARFTTVMAVDIDAFGRRMKAM